MTHLPSRKRSSLIAAATVLTGRRLNRHAITEREWQREAWRHYDLSGELRYATRYEANATSRARLIAARRNPDPAGTPLELADEHPASQIISSFLGGTDSQAQALARVDTQLTVSGISYIVMFEHEGNERWLVLSSEEISFRAGRWHLTVDGTDREFDAENIVVIRIWTPHARKFWEPDSPVRALLPVLRELEGLTKHVGASIDSRLAGAGLLVLPQEMTFVSNRDDIGDDQDPFVVELVEAMTAPIEDRDSASAVVPLVIKVPGDLIDDIKHLSFSTPFDQETKTLRDEAIRRLALGLDLPPEIMLGLGDANHWTAWQIEESSVKLHIEPKLATITQGITQGYLHPALEALGEDTNDIIAWYDTTPLKLRPNRSQDAEALHHDLLITDGARRRAAGFTEDDAPDETELRDQILLHVVRNAPQLAGEILPLLGFEGFAPDERQVNTERDDEDSNTPDSGDTEPEGDVRPIQRGA